MRNLSSRTKLIIGIVLFLIASTVAIIIAARNNTPAPQTQEQTNSYVDPSSGETVVENGNLPVSRDGQPSNTPLFLGFSKLIDRGLTSNQVEVLKAAFVGFSDKQSSPLKQVSVVVNDIQRILPGDDPNAPSTLTFPVKINKTDDYFARAEYTDINSATLKLYKADKTTLVFTQ